MRPSLETLKGKKDLVGCEIGVQAGANARSMLKNLDLKRLYLVDPYGEPAGISIKTFKTVQPKFEEFIKDTEIVWLIKKSEDVTDNEIPHGTLDFVYIDGDHSYKTVMKDLELYWPRVKTGGMVSGHDYYVDKTEKGVIVNAHGDVVKAVDEFFARMGYKGYYLEEPVPECNFKKHKIFQVSGTDWWVYK